MWSEQMISIRTKMICLDISPWDYEFALRNSWQRFRYGLNTFLHVEGTR